MEFETKFHLHVAISKATSQQLFDVSVSITVLQKARETALKEPTIENKREVLELSDNLAEQLAKLIG